MEPSAAVVFLRRQAALTISVTWLTLQARHSSFRFRLLDLFIVFEADIRT